MAAAPFVSLVVVPLAFSRRRPRAGRRREPDDEELGAGPRRALRAGRALRSCSPSRRCSTARVLTADATAADAAVAGYVFNVLLIARAPLQLFQAIQGSLLPHLAGLRGDARAAPSSTARSGSRCSRSPASRARSRSGCCRSARGRWACCSTTTPTTAAGRARARRARAWAAHLAAGTLNQAALARDHARARGRGVARRRARCSSAWMLAPIVDDELLRAEVGYLGAATLLCGLLTLVYRRPPRATAPELPLD